LANSTAVGVRNLRGSVGGSVRGFSSRRISRREAPASSEARSYERLMDLGVKLLVLGLGVWVLG